MGDLHRVSRYGEVWEPQRLREYLNVAEKLREHVVFSGGMAWHIMSPEGHVEYRHAHDHKDLDLMVKGSEVPTALAILFGLGFRKVSTIYDKLPSKEEFRRYEKDSAHGKLTVDFFVRDVPWREIRGWKVVEPATLLTFYSSFHSSKSCFAVLAAQRLLGLGKDPVGSQELVQIPT